MNIQQAKEQIKYAVAAYLEKNNQGDYLIPVQSQRPLFVMGAPGIGKTDIMKQISQELSIGMVSYSMTHHTRQSALGLPYICEKSYKGEKYQVSEYTMSEILSTIYDVVEEDGVSEGILFLDEINCVSETLTPSMLQFLQFKTFGKHKVPDGWVVVTAGNPPEYNNSVREFDIVTWDRLKRIDVEPDFQTWITHAKITGVHPAILSYLEIKQNDFYKVETSVDGKSFVTARGWVDLSQMIRIFEKKEFPVDETLVMQYLQNKEVAKNFAVYYDLFQKYRADYEIPEILAGIHSDAVLERAKKAPFDEQLALITLLIEALTKGMRDVCLMDKWGIAFGKESMLLKSAQSIEEITDHISKKKEELSKKRHANAISQEEIQVHLKVSECFEEMKAQFATSNEPISVTKYSKDFYLKHKKSQKKKQEATQAELGNALDFSKAAFGDSQSFFLVLTELTATPVCAEFVSKCGGEQYKKYNSTLLVHDDQQKLIKEIDDIEELWGALE